MTRRGVGLVVPARERRRSSPLSSTQARGCSGPTRIPDRFRPIGLAGRLLRPASLGGREGNLLLEEPEGFRELSEEPCRIRPALHPNPPARIFPCQMLRSY